MVNSIISSLLLLLITVQHYGASFAPKFHSKPTYMHFTPLQQNQQQQRIKYYSLFHSTTKINNQKDNDIIDAEFYSNNDNQNENDFQTTTFTNNQKTSPLQASLASVEPKLSSLAIDFIDPLYTSSNQQRFIPCRMAFTIKVDDQEYVLGTPVDTQVAIYVEDSKTNTASFLDPDEEENIEIMERVASIFEQKYQHLSSPLSSPLSSSSTAVDDTNNNIQTIRFKRTPRTLTVEGDLSTITGNWKNDENKKINEVTNIAKDILKEIEKNDDSIDDDSYFDDFFTKELGKNFKQDALNSWDEDNLDQEERELFDLFNVPGLGTEQNDDVGIKDLLQEVFDGQDELLAKEEEEKSNRQTEAGLRLVGFTDKNEGKIYSLVQLLQPMILVGKIHPSLEMDQRMLLSQDEAEEIIPLLEKEFQEDFQKAGLKLAP
mmetsp:Transcript_25753/g.31742  ORF Transcript_25753/g.31742 Transcript_25753/m.31742 type:complete len:431 (+) Transcript_25753:136-1428(+)